MRHVTQTGVSVHLAIKGFINTMDYGEDKPDREMRNAILFIPDKYLDEAYAAVCDSVYGFSVKAGDMDDDKKRLFMSKTFEKLNIVFKPFTVAENRRAPLFSIIRGTLDNALVDFNKYTTVGAVALDEMMLQGEDHFSTVKADLVKHLSENNYSSFLHWTESADDKAS